MSILGGTRHWFGPTVGAVAITCLLFAFTGGDYAVLGKGAIGLILVIGILFMPEGVMGKLRRKTGSLSPAGGEMRGEEKSPPLPLGEGRGEGATAHPHPHPHLHPEISLKTFSGD